MDRQEEVKHAMALESGVKHEMLGRPINVVVVVLATVLVETCVLLGMAKEDFMARIEKSWDYEIDRGKNKEGLN